MVWKKTRFNLKHVMERPKCEVCGHIFEDGEKGWANYSSGAVHRRRPIGSPMNVGYRQSSFYRCMKCYKLIWH